MDSEGERILGYFMLVVSQFMRKADSDPCSERKRERDISLWKNGPLHKGK